MLLADKILFDDDYVLMHLYESIFSNVWPIREGGGRKFTKRTYIEEGRSETYESVQGEIGHYIREDTYVSK